MVFMWHYIFVPGFLGLNYVAEASELLEESYARLMNVKLDRINTPSGSEAALLNIVGNLGWIGAETNIHPVTVLSQIGIRTPNADLWKQKLTHLTTTVVWNLLAAAPQSNAQLRFVKLVVSFQN